MLKAYVDASILFKAETLAGAVLMNRDQDVRRNEPRPRDRQREGSFRVHSPASTE